jgi:hypothetical protein
MLTTYFPELALQQSISSQYTEYIHLQRTFANKWKDVVRKNAKHGRKLRVSFSAVGSNALPNMAMKIQQKVKCVTSTDEAVFHVYGKMKMHFGLRRAHPRATQEMERAVQGLWPLGFSFVHTQHGTRVQLAIPKIRGAELLPTAVFQRDGASPH